jgi:hypothetical protein
MFRAGFDDRFQAESGCSILTPDDGQREWPKHGEFYNRINLNN